MTGKEPYLRATWSRPCAFSRCCQSGVRSPGRRRGIRSARPAFSRNREPNSALPPSSVITSSSMSFGSMISSSIGGVAPAGSEGQRPRRVHAGAEWRQDADAPVADLVPEALDDDGAVRRDGSSRRLLIVEKREQVLGSLLVARMLLGQPLQRPLPGQRGELPGSLPDRLPQLVRATRPLALPERDRTRDSRRRRDEHPVARDLFDPPGGSAEHEGLTCP